MVLCFLLTLSFSLHDFGCYRNILILINKENCRQSMKSDHILAKGPDIVAVRQEERLL